MNRWRIIVGRSPAAFMASAVTLLAGAVGAAVLAPALFLAWLNGAPATSRDGAVSVPPGAAAGAIVRRLAEDGQVRSERWVRFLLRVTGAGRRLRVGLYPVAKGDSAWGLVRTLARGKSLTVRVTVPEGWPAARIGERLEAQGVCGKDAFLTVVSSAAAEGFLFPDTYEFDPFISAERAANLMLAHFGRSWREAVESSSESLRGVELSTVSVRLDRVRLADGRRWWSARDVVTLASIVEREGGRPEERPLIAAVYHNRLKKRMHMDADPTVQYALGEWKGRLLYRDLEVDSPYNTYKVYGLPPGPIGNPGLEAIRAVLKPAKSPALYFVADDAGGHVFSVNFSEHLRNVRAHRRRRSS